MKRILIIAISSLVGVSVYAQQEQMFTHYMYNTLSINPAYAGSREALTVTALGRFQWVGFSGAPISQNLTLHSPIASQNIGLGMSVLNQKIGPTNTTSLFADFAYRMRVSKTARLCFGLKAGFNSFSADLNDLNLENQNDAAFRQNLSSKMLPNIGGGLYFQSTNFYAGISSPGFLQNKFFGSDTAIYANTSGQRRHYYFITGGVIGINPALKFKPTALLKMVEKSTWQLDLTASLLMNDMFSIGAMYRTGDGFGALVGVNINQQFMVGYSFDWSTGVRTGTYNSGSHELMLRYDFIFNKEAKIKSPRYF
jgi:type IX secretion system PorP/SprF family membrane protein